MIMEELAQELQRVCNALYGVTEETWMNEYFLLLQPDVIFDSSFGLFTQLGTMSEYKDPNKGFQFWDGKQIIESQESKPVTITIKPEDYGTPV
jgi:hypothetical protein